MVSGKKTTSAALRRCPRSSISVPSRSRNTAGRVADPMFLLFTDMVASLLKQLCLLLLMAFTWESLLLTID